MLQLPAAADPERTNLQWASTQACVTASQPVTMRPCVLVLSSPRSPTCLLDWPLPQRVPPQFLSADGGGEADKYIAPVAPARPGTDAKDRGTDQVSRGSTRSVQHPKRTRFQLWGGREPGRCEQLGTGPWGGAAAHSTCVLPGPQLFPSHLLHCYHHEAACSDSAAPHYL